MLARLRAGLETPIDVASLALFRALFGALLFVGTVRLLAKGFVHEAFIVPRFLFAPWPLQSVLVPLPGVGMYVVYGAIAALSLAVALGLFTRVAAALLCVLFTYAHFLDLTNYLNHYWLVTLLTALLAALPGAGGALSLDGRLWPQKRRSHVATWVLYLFRFQVALVYFFAGATKLRHDWLFLAEPMRIWLGANTDMPIVGPLFRQTWTAYVMSFAGALYDLTIPLWLLFPRSRPFAFATVVTFHLVTARLFNIGMFPFFMMAASTLFFDPSWVRQKLRLGAPAPDVERAGQRAPLAALALYAVVQIALPLRGRLYDGNLLWHEQGYRFGWNVMLMEKMGSAEFSLVDRESGARRLVRVRDHLTRSQEKAMATQPDMILAFAHHLATEERRAGRDVGVFADVYVVLNGRPAARFVDPSVDLGSEADGFAPKRWILPPPL